MVNKQMDPFYEENKEFIDDLLREMEPLSDTVSKSLKGDDEQNFCKDNIDKKIVIKIIGGNERSGKLADISNFGILVFSDDEYHFYYKHFVESYYIDE